MTACDLSSCETGPCIVSDPPLAVDASNLVDSDKNTGGVRADIPSAGGEVDVTPGCVAPEVPSSDWVPQFERQEIWVMNTEYRLFGKRGPEVAPWATHWSRLDEMAKCLAVSPGFAAFRIFWADSVISVEGSGLGEWMRFIGKRAPSEQQMVKFLWANIHAAWYGRKKTRTMRQARAAEDWIEDYATCDLQPVPGVYVWRNGHCDDEVWDACEAVEKGKRTWPSRPTVENLAFYVGRLLINDMSHVRKSHVASEAAVGLLLDVEGAQLRFWSEAPLSSPKKGTRDPEACVTVLGGPLGIPESTKALIQAAFAVERIPLLKVSLGPDEQMAHVCVAHIRIAESTGSYKAAVVDLHRLGPEKYAKLLRIGDAALLRVGQSLCASKEDRNRERRRHGSWLQTARRKRRMLRRAPQSQQHTSKTQVGAIL